jgi:regulator of replication initiation timing
LIDKVAQLENEMQSATRTIEDLKRTLFEKYMILEENERVNRDARVKLESEIS